MLLISLSNNKFFKFATVGILATFAHASIYLILLTCLEINEQTSNILGFLVAFFTSYYGQRYWTFTNRNISSKSKTKLKFLVSSVVSLVLNSLWVYINSNLLGLNSKYAVIGIVFITPLIIFIILNYWVFT